MKLGICLHGASPQTPSHKEVPAGGHLNAPQTQFAGGNCFCWADFVAESIILAQLSFFSRSYPGSGLSSSPTSTKCFKLAPAFCCLL